MVAVIHSALPQAAGTQANAVRRCAHCATPLGDAEGAEFCCAGCRTAFRLVHDLGLENFYRLLPDDEQLSRPDTAGDYRSWNSDDFLREFASCDAAGRWSVRFQVAGLNCYACVWLCEQAAAKLTPAAEFTLNFATGIAELQFDGDDRPLANLTAALARLGYQATPVRPGEALPLRTDWLRLGLAAFCAINTMSFAWVEYLATPGTVESELSWLLRGLSWLLTTLSLCYSGGPILQRGWQDARRVRPSIDSGVALGLVAAYGYSSWHIRPAGAVYFDSITAVIALLLAGRLLQKRVLATAERQLLQGTTDAAAYVRCLAGDCERFVPRSTLHQGDLLRVLPGEVVPVRCVCVAGQGEISLESLTGEAAPQLCMPGTLVRAGAVVGTKALTLRAQEDGLGHYLDEVRRVTRRLLLDKGKLGSLADRLAAAFFWFSVAAAAVTLTVTWVLFTPEIAVARTMALLLVACPCVFGFGAPLAFAGCGAHALQHGVAFKNQNAIEGLAAARRALFDKTGTLTAGAPSARLLHEDVAGVSLPLLHAMLGQAAAASAHHVPQAIATWALQNLPAPQTLADASVTEEMAAGLTVTAGHHKLVLGHPRFVQKLLSVPLGAEVNTRAQVCLAFDGRLISTFAVDDPLRPEAAALMAALRGLGVIPQILSGDRGERAEEVGRQLAVEATGDLSPVAKALAVVGLKRAEPVLMVGNGFNDALAMGQAQVGVATMAASSAAKLAADVTLLRPDLMDLVGAIAMSRAAVQAVRRAFVFAAIYNSVSMALAASGLVSPAVAAILMPLNSIMVTCVIRASIVRAPKSSRMEAS